MVILWISLSLNIPVLYSANDVRLVSLSELDFDLVPLVRFGVLEKQVETPRARLRTFLVLEDEIS
jgi:hypothetical protein